MAVKNNNLKHVILDTCEDPDCEIHHPDVALEEQVITDHELAYFLAGAFAMETAIRQELYRSVPHGDDVRELFIQCALRAGRPLVKMAEGRY